MPAVRLTVPTIGTKLTLTRGWSFTLHAESRNDAFGERLGCKDIPPGQRWGQWKNQESRVCLPKGTLLTVSRIYIRQNNGDYDSITFSIKKGDCPDKKVYGRFWVKLGDANRITCEWDMDTVKVAETDPITALGEIVS